MIFPFYEKALQLFAKTQKQQIIKGLKKYPEPFNPHSWTPEELLNHALEETVDLTHYLVGLKELLDVKDVQIKDLQNEIEGLSSELKKYQGVYLNKVADIPFPTGYTTYFDIEKKQWIQVPKYFDQDDQH